MQDIKNKEFKKVYLLYGEEAYLRKQYRDRLREAACEPGDSMNIHFFEGKDISAAQVIDLAETMPFLAQRRVIVLENTGWFKKGGEQMAEYLAGQPETTLLMFVERETDKRTQLFKAVKKYGKAAEFAVQDEATLVRWIAGILKKEKKQADSTTVQYFLAKTGTDMEHIRMELEKLICYLGDRERITCQDIDAVCIEQIQNRIFDMIGAIGEKQKMKALELYYDLLALRESPRGILALMERQFNIWLQIGELKKKGYQGRAIAEKVGVPPFTVQKYLRQAEKFKTAELREALENCIHSEEMINTGRLTDRLGVELLIVQYSQ